MHDKNGTPLAVGDRVTVTGVITALQPGEEYCNLSIETEISMYPSDAKTTLTLNTQQVEKTGCVPGARVAAIDHLTRLLTPETKELGVRAAEVLIGLPEFAPHFSVLLNANQVAKTKEQPTALRFGPPVQ